MKFNWRSFGIAAIASFGLGAAIAWAAQTNYLGTVFIADPTVLTRQLVVNSDGSINATVVSGGGVPSITGTVNQIIETGSPGATTLSLANPVILPGALTVPAPTATATLTTDQSQASGGSALLPFVATTGVAVGQTVVGTSIPLGARVASIVNDAQVSFTANGVSASGQKILTTTATTGAVAGQQCTDITTPAAIGAGNVIASVQAGVSITMTTNLTNATVGADTITCDPVVTLNVSSTGTIASGAVITFNPNQASLSSSSSFYDNGDASINGNLNLGGIFGFTNALGTMAFVRTLPMVQLIAPDSTGNNGTWGTSQFVVSTTAGATVAGMGFGFNAVSNYGWIQTGHPGTGGSDLHIKTGSSTNSTYFDSTLDSTAYGNGSVALSGGLGVAKNIFTNGTLTLGTPLGTGSGGTGDGGTAWTHTNPTASCGGGTPTTITVDLYYKTLAKTTFFNAHVTLTNIGTCTGSVSFPLPNTLTGSTAAPAQNTDAGTLLVANLYPSSLQIYATGFLFPGTSGQNVYTSGVYQNN